MSCSVVSSLAGDNLDSCMTSRRLEASELRRARKAARETRNRLLSDSSDELPKSILKNSRQIPTKRSVSECVDDLSQIMDDLDLNIHDLPKTTRRFCPIHHDFNEADEEEIDDEEDDDGDDDDDDDDNEDNDVEDSEDDAVNTTDDNNGVEAIVSNDGQANATGSKQVGDQESPTQGQQNCEKNGSSKKSSTNDLNKNTHEQAKKKNSKKGGKICDCDFSDSEQDTKPKKFVRFDEHVYETVFFASRLYDRRSFAKYHFSTRHHPQNKQQNNVNKKAKKNKNHKKSDSGDEQIDGSLTNLKSDTCNKKPTKSQRAKQSKRDKKKRLQKRDDTLETSSDDQGYCSSFQSFSD